jgi:hypothetical protein
MPTTLRIAAALATLALAAHTLAAPLAPILQRSAALQCEGRKVELQADCFSYIDEVLACTRQKLSFSDASGKKLNVRAYKAAPKEEGDDYPIVEEKVSALTCVETGAKEKFVVATMRTGGNCKSCEWHDVYTVDGVLAGSDRDRKKKDKIVTDAVDSVYDKKAKRVLGKNVLIDFYFLRDK